MNINVGVSMNANTATNMNLNTNPNPNPNPNTTSIPSRSNTNTSTSIKINEIWLKRIVPTTTMATTTMIVIMTVAMTMMSPSHSQAEVVFAPSIAYDYEKVSDSTGAFSDADTRTAAIDLRLGYLFSANGFFAGGLYKIETNSYDNGDLKGFVLGPSGGWIRGPFSVIATYYLMAERRYTFGNQETKLSSGQGYQLDLAFTPQIATNLGFGPQLSYRSVKYTKSQVGSGAETGNSYETTAWIPYFAFWFVF